MKRIFTLTFLILIVIYSYGQGVSFSYLIPKNGEIAAPISPFSIRGIGIGKIVGIETGGSFYFIPGLPAKDLPFKSKESIFGSQYAFLVPLQAFLNIPIKRARIKFLAGGFGWYTISPKINNGNLDKALRGYTSWDVVTSDYQFENKIGWGLIGGFEIEFQITKNAALSFQTQYLNGHAKAPMTGSYAGGNIGNPISSVDADFTEAKASIEGLEISIGVSLLR